MLDLYSKKANRKTFESYTKKHKPDFFFFNGHGSDTVLAGYNDEPILISNQYEITFHCLLQGKFGIRENFYPVI